MLPARQAHLTACRRGFLWGGMGGGVVGDFMCLSVGDACEALLVLLAPQFTSASLCCSLRAVSSLQARSPCQVGPNGEQISVNESGFYPLPWEAYAGTVLTVVGGVLLCRSSSLILSPPPPLPNCISYTFA